jgi:hypothetical protein
MLMSSSRRHPFGEGIQLAKQRAILILVALALVAVAVAVIAYWPKRYTVGQRVSDATVFWNDREAFVFLSENTTGVSRNVFQEKLAATRYAYLTALLGGFPDFSKIEVIAFHFVPSRQLERFVLPEHSTLYGSWKLAGSRLQLIPAAGSDSRGFRWDGAKFVAVSPPPTSTPPAKAGEDANGTLTEDDLDSSDDEAEGALPKAERKTFKDAGWHYKFLSGYSGQASTATLPISIAGETFSLTIENSPLKKFDGRPLDILTFGMKSIHLAGGKIAGGQQALWSQSGWKEISKQEYESLQREYGGKFRNFQRPAMSLVWLALLAFLVLWRFSGWIHMLFTFSTMKSRVLKRMPTMYSFPPATPSQFAALDLDALDRYTPALEGMGFVRLLDFSLVSDSTTTVPCFCRLLVHTRHHCFAEISQFFPKGKTPLPLKCALQSSLQDGWTLSFSDRKPQATGSLLRRRRALVIGMPDVAIGDLLHAFLKMRDQICLDLGIAPVNDDTLQAYINKMQRSASELREAVQQKSFVKGIPEVYLRKFSLMKTKPEYVWLGDYPKESERRKQGIGSFDAIAR